MKILGMIAQKGGTGKTTLSIHLAVQATLSGMHVLLADIDPQASASSWGRRRREQEPTLIRSDGNTIADIVRSARGRRYDFVIIDTAPHSSDDAIACASLADWIYIPTRPAILDLDAIGPSTDLVARVGVSASIVLNGCPPPTQFGEARIVTEARDALRAYAVPVCEVAISQRIAFSHALIDGQSVSEYDGSGRAAGEINRLWNSLREGLSI